MIMISFAVKKGGTGKTTICKNVAYKLAQDNNKVLLSAGNQIPQYRPAVCSFFVNKW